ncbi:MAG: hypothetical protein HY879_03055 [Deltaproteobacteria bacterium]|nr:hypothetical protein [Deltaproteobacteria bacterium]
METIAIYREEVIKTYGFVERTGLFMVTLDLPSDRLTYWGDDLFTLISRLGLSLVLQIARPAAAGTLRLHLLLDETPAGPGGMDWHQVLLDEYPGGWQMDQAVDLVYFQGPHYGDRYGIAYEALKALDTCGLPILAMACLGASVYLILPEGKAGPAREALKQAFMIPDRGAETGRPGSIR